MDEVAELFGGEIEEPEEKRVIRRLFLVLFKCMCISRVENVSSC